MNIPSSALQSALSFSRRLAYFTKKLSCVGLFLLLGQLVVMGQADLVLIPSSTSVTDIGTTFTVRVEIQPVNGQLVDGASLNFTYDPKIIEVNGSDAFSVPNDPFNLPINLPYVTSGTTSSSITYDGGSTPPFPNSNFEVFTVEFITVGMGTAELNFGGVNIIASNGQDITRNTTGTTVVVGPDNELPTVAITSPRDRASFVTGDDVTITASASDSDGTITQVEFFDGTASLGTDNTAPFAVTLTNITAGSHLLTAVATDSDGGETTSETVTISASSQQADLVLIPSAMTVTDIGTTFTVRVEIQPVDNQLVDGASLNFTYDPRIIEVNGSDAFSVPNDPFNLPINLPFVTSGLPCAGGSKLPWVGKRHRKYRCAPYGRLLHLQPCLSCPSWWQPRMRVPARSD